MISLYAGSFDPITRGHEWIIDNAPGELTIAVADNPAKRSTFTAAVRADLVRETTRGRRRIQVIGLVYLAEFAAEIGADYIIRGVRSVADYEYERAYADVNRTINPHPIHMLMMPPPELASVSSSVVKSLVGPAGWEAVVAKYVSPVVLEALRAL